jgi:hypothetical protein
MIVAYYTALDDGTYWRSELDTTTMIRTMQQITADEYLDAMNRRDELIGDWT